MREPLWLFRKRVTHEDQVTHEALHLMKVYIKILLEGLDYMPQCILEEHHVDLFVKFIKRMLHWLPEERATAAEVQRDPWLHLRTT
jgi:hypothetical protein